MKHSIQQTLTNKPFSRCQFQTCASEKPSQTLHVVSSGLNSQVVEMSLTPPKANWFTSGENRGFNLPDMPLGRWCKVSWHQAEDSSCLQRHSGSKLSAPGWIWFLLLFLHSSYLAGEASVSNWWKAKVILILLWDSVLNCIIYKQRSFFIINGIENQNHQGKLYKSY